ncbi:MAG: hypothetical protein ABWY06_16795 [Pseudomonas sp.]|uniref:hypothetical protein n=1 Tax=Pseudomonas sp. TaxID=306 RepID=UPI00339467DD
MSTFQELAAALQGTSPTNGWDAVLALDQARVNALFFQQYLNAGPTNPRAGQPLRVMLSLGEGSTYCILDVELGPPEWTFAPGSSDATLTMELIKGSVIAFDPSTPAVHNAIYIRPKESRLVGALVLAKVTGEVNTLGAVVADLGASAYSPTIVGVDPGSLLNTEIGNAVSAFFAHNGMNFHIGSVAVGSVPALMPTDFHFAVQHQAGSDQACVLLLIKTSGAEGGGAPLPSYPIPTGQTSALLFSERTLFKDVLPQQLIKVFAPFNATFEGRQDTAGSWFTVATGGTVSMGRVGDPGNHMEQAFSDGNVQFPMNGFTISHKDGTQYVDWKPTYTGPWRASKNDCHFDTHGNGSCHWIVLDPIDIALRAEYVQHGAPVLDTGDSAVSFPAGNSPTVTLEADNPGWWALYSTRIDGTIVAAINAALTGMLKNFSIPDIHLFALTSLLFPNKHVVHLEQVALPNGLFLSGKLDQPLSLTPASTTLAPGQSVQLEVTGHPAADYLWQIKPSIGTIEAGRYTAPAALATAEVVVVTAISRKDAGLSASAMLLVYQNPAASGISVAPARCLVTPGQQVQLSTSDATQKPLPVQWTLSPNLGQIRPGFGPGLYHYTAPASLAQATDVTASAVDPSNPKLTGTALIRVVPSTAVVLAPAQASLKCGATLALKAEDAGESVGELRWLVYPVGAGTVVTQVDDDSQAIYTAPAGLALGAQAYVVAYRVNEHGAGLGTTIISLSA